MLTVQDLLTSELQPELELLRPLGSGSTAEVYLARESALQRLVAVKVLRSQLAADPVARKRFEREAQSAARISHPNVTVIHRIGRLSNDIPYIVLEYVDGRTIRDVVEARGALELSEARTLLAGVASALAAAHERGIVHRDVRLDNVFLENRTGRAVLADFGIAALLETGASSVTRLTMGGVRMGEPSHMSPEQIRGEPVTAQSDVYAFGIVAYEVLTGRGPYEARTAAEVLSAHLQQEPRPLRELRPEVEPRLAALIESCLAKEPQRRPQAREIAEALRGAPAAGGAAAPEGALAVFLSELKRRRVYQVLAGYTAVALAVLGGAQTVFEAFDLPHWSYKLTVATTLAGLPVAVILAWAYDLTAGGIRRTRSRSTSGRGWQTLKWSGLGASILIAALVAWLLLHDG